MIIILGTGVDFQLLSRQLNEIAFHYKDNHSDSTEQQKPFFFVRSAQLWQISDSLWWCYWGQFQWESEFKPTTFFTAAQEANCPCQSVSSAEVIFEDRPADEIHHSVTRSSKHAISPSIFCDGFFLAEKMCWWMMFIVFSSWPSWLKEETGHCTEPGSWAMTPSFISFLRGVPKWLLSRPAWDPERLEDDVPHRAGARGSNHLPVWPWLRPGGTRDPHLSVRPLLELAAPILWKEWVTLLFKPLLHICVVCVCECVCVCVCVCVCLDCL